MERTIVKPGAQMWFLGFYPGHHQGGPSFAFYAKGGMRTSSFWNGVPAATH
jgi:hypothetical protein